MFEWINRLKKKWQDPSVYAVVLGGIGTNCSYVAIVIAYSLEEAVNLAAERSKQSHPCAVRHNWTLNVWDKKEMKEIVEATTFSEIVEKETKSKSLDKNILMKQIISGKNVMLFEQNRFRFNKDEIKYLEGELSRI